MKTRLTELHDELRAVLDEDRIVLTYSPRFRACYLISINPGYSLNQLGYDKGPGEDELVGILLNFCPWSGAPLPGDLDDEWFEVIETELGLEDFHIFSPVDVLPEEMLSEEWWVRRNIGPTNEALRDDWEKPPHVDYTVTGPDWDSPPGFLRPVCTPPHICRACMGPRRRKRLRPRRRRNGPSGGGRSEPVVPRVQRVGSA